MSNNKQSSVEWLEDKLNNVKPTEFCSIETIKEWVQQAKAIHKKEIINAHLEGQCDETEGYPIFIAENYYNETYGGNND